MPDDDVGHGNESGIGVGWRRHRPPIGADETGNPVPVHVATVSSDHVCCTRHWRNSVVFHQHHDRSTDHQGGVAGSLATFSSPLLPSWAAPPHGAASFVLAAAP